MHTRTRRRSPLRILGLRVALPLVVGATVIGLVCMGVTVVSLVLPALAAQAVPVSTSLDTCSGRTMQMAAHTDDDLLFMNPDVQRDIEAGLCVRSVYLTTGDAARVDDYWRMREDGIRAAYATMAGVPDEWTTSSLVVDGQPLTMVSLDAAPGISLVFMHLPDGNRRGTGNRIHDHQSLRRLWLGEIDRIDAVDGTATYDLTGLSATLTTLVDDFDPGTVRTQDWTIGFAEGDNADHVAVAFLVHAAMLATDAEHTVLAYAGYPSWTSGANVSGRDLGLKADAIIAYAHYDPKLCANPRCLESLVTSIRTARQYVVTTEVLGGGTGEPLVRPVAP
jgi:LmbE family N-acetylglucosaminyl deacetylase